MVAFTVIGQMAGGTVNGKIMIWRALDTWEDTVLEQLSVQIGTYHSKMSIRVGLWWTLGQEDASSSFL